MAVTEVVAQFEALDSNEKKAVVAALNNLAPPPADSVANATLWLIIVTALALLLVGGAVLLFVLVLKDKDTAVLTPLVTGALGALTGLLAPSPAKGQNA